MLSWRGREPEQKIEFDYVKMKYEDITFPDVSRKPINYNSYVMNREEKVRYLAAATVVLFIIGYIFFDSMAAGLIICLGGLYYPKYKAAELMAKRKEELNLQFKDALYSLSTAISAGYALETALRTTLRDLHLQYPGNEAYIIQEFEYICRRIELNEPVEVVLDSFAERSGLEDIKNFADVITICKRTGGNLIEVISSTSSMIVDKIEIYQDIELLLTKQKFEQKILNIMPVVFISMIKFGGSGYMDALYSSPKGYLLMGTALIIIIAAALVSKKIFDIRV